MKPRLGIFYSDVNKDAEVQNMINGAISYFKGAGWDFTTLLSSLSEKNKTIIALKRALELLEEMEEPDQEEVTITEEAIKCLKSEIADILIELSLPIEAITLYCKMAQSTDPSLLTNHPVLISMIAQGRAEVVTDG